ncbi:MAG: hypothetical protein ABIA63_02595 [bacterium]
MGIPIFYTVFFVFFGGICDFNTQAESKSVGYDSGAVYSVSNEIKKIDDKLEKYMKEYWDLTAKIVDIKDNIITEIRSKKKLNKQYLKLVCKRQEINKKIELLCDKNRLLKYQLYNLKVCSKSLVTKR